MKLKDKEVKKLVSFGNYLLSKERKKTIQEKNNIKFVNDCDVSNWIESQEDNNV